MFGFFITSCVILQKNDAEAVLVRDGCMFVGYDHEKGEA
jgi:hypothetical protein